MPGLRLAVAPVVGAIVRPVVPRLLGMQRNRVLVHVVGGLNWLLVGAFQFDLVAAIFGGQQAVLARIVYVVVGLRAIWQITGLGALTNDHHTSVRH